MATFTQTDCFRLALPWAGAAALAVPVLLRGSLPGALVFVLAVAAFAGVLRYAQRRCGGAAVAEIAAAPVAAPIRSVAAPAAVPIEKPAAKPAPIAAAPAAATGGGAGAARPKALPAAHGGAPDDLKRLKGVGPKLETLLHSLGVYHFDQIAAWTPNEVAWMDEHLEGFRGRVTRDDWVGQARILSTGGVTAFAARVDRGGAPTSRA